MILLIFSRYIPGLILNSVTVDIIEETNEIIEVPLRYSGTVLDLLQVNDGTLPRSMSSLQSVTHLPI